LREELACVQSLISQVSADIEGALETGDQEAQDRLMEFRRKLQADSFDLQVELALTDDLPPAE
jgi:hypothetical protein